MAVRAIFYNAIIFVAKIYFEPWKYTHKYIIV